MTKAVITIQKNGAVSFLYDEKLEGLTKYGKTTVQRLSDIEFNEEEQLWETRVNGVVLASHKTRSQALLWEKEYFSNLLRAGRLLPKEE